MTQFFHEPRFLLARVVVYTFCGVGGYDEAFVFAAPFDATADRNASEWAIVTEFVNKGYGSSCIERRISGKVNVRSECHNGQMKVQFTYLCRRLGHVHEGYYSRNFHWAVVAVLDELLFSLAPRRVSK